MTMPVIPVLPPSIVSSNQLYEVTDKDMKKLTTDSSSALNESSDGARSYEGSHTDGESIDTISNGRMLKI